MIQKTYTFSAPPNTTGRQLHQRFLSTVVHNLGEGPSEPQVPESKFLSQGGNMIQRQRLQNSAGLAASLTEGLVVQLDTAAVCVSQVRGVHRKVSSHKTL